MRFFNFFKKNVLSILVLFLLAFIPLYPKLPLVDVKNTWVYIRVEDFIVFFVLTVWFVFLLKKKITLKTPLTIPILAFWIIGAIATIHGVVIIFPTIAHVFPNVALLAYLRHIEYLSLFFVAYAAVKSRKFVLASIWTVIVTLLGVIIYGFGQKYLSLPAYLTMNEEYAKGIPIIISPLNRVSSTFAGHYDLAAYLVLVLPIVISLIFGFRNLFIKAFLAVVSLLGFGLLFMTVSRVSFFVVFIALFFVFLFHKKKLVFILTPLVLVGGVVFLLTQQSLLTRFGSTIQETDVLVHARTGEAIGHVTFHPRDYLYDKIIIQNDESGPNSKPITALEQQRALKEGVPLHLIPYRLPREAPIIQAELTSTGESLPQGSGYINLSLSPVTKRLNNFFLEYPPKGATSAATVQRVYGEFLVKRASAYDLSFTTRFQGEWPNALKAFSRNLLFGSGYGSVSLAVDNNYLRMLGETGLLGTASFMLLFLILGLYIKNYISRVESRVVRSFILGFAAGVIGLFLNAVLIDVFEASKIAFQLWLLTGIVMGALTLAHTERFQTYKEIKLLLLSPIAITIYFILLIIAIYLPSINNYFTGDDFTWFRWAADCNFPGNICSSPLSIINQYFFNSEGFFYRPGTKVYFLLMYPLFWLNQVVYHAVSIVLHIIVVALLYILARKVLKNELLAALSGFLFIIISGYLEMVVWVSATGHLFNAVFILSSFLLFIKWYETKKSIYFAASLIFSLLAVLFHELGIISPMLALSYVAASSKSASLRSIIENLRQKVYFLLFTPVILYLIVRYVAHTHWFSGDYSYNLLKLPFNALGNAFGYLAMTIVGPMSYTFYESLRNITRSNIPIAVFLGAVVLTVLYFSFLAVKKYFNAEEKSVIVFSFLFFLICLVPFLGLGNITFRYSYLASFGIVMILVVLTNKFYRHLLYYGKDTAAFAMASLLSVLCLFHIIQTQQTIIEWDGAGSKVKNFLTSIESLYEEEWSKKDSGIMLYFIDVPIKNGDAWVFPVGLEDAIWFAFKNDSIKIQKVSSLSEVDESAFTTKNNRVFEFRSDGTLKRYVWSKKGPVEYEEN